MTITVDGFLERLKSRITIPNNQVLLTNDKMLGMADDVMKERMIPLLLSVNQNYFVVVEEVPGVADQDTYSIPYRSIGRGLRDLKVRWGAEENGLNNMAMIALEDANMWGNNAITNAPWAFYFRGDKFIILPFPQDDNFTLHLFYNMQPNNLVESSDACLVQSVSTNIVTCLNVPTGYSAGVTIDFIQGQSGCSTLDFDVAIAGAAGNQITFASADDIPTDLAAGDWISLAKTSPVIQLPDEAEPLLLCWTAERICYAIGDFEGADKLAQRSVEIATNLRMVLSPRIEGAQTKIVNRNGLLRGQGYRGWRFWNGNTF